MGNPPELGNLFWEYVVYSLGVLKQMQVVDQIVLLEELPCLFDFCTL
jgi:hypothetical protein